MCDCGNETILQSNTLTSGHTSSCGCLNSYYNMYINQYLDKIGVKHISEYSVCINEKRYRFDFYLPDYNLMIEYDGSQHFVVSRFHKDNKEKNLQDLKNIQEHDHIKNEYCKDNKINLLRIPYWDCENIETIIDDCLQRLNDKGFVEVA